MAKVLVNETSLTSIADAIREKNGTAATYKPSEMAAAIAAIEVGGGSAVEIPQLTGTVKYFDSFNHWNWFIEAYRNIITTNNITNAEYMFAESDTLEEVPFELNMKAGEYVQGSGMFQRCKKLKYIAPINNAQFTTTQQMFQYCQNLRELPIMNNYDTKHDGRNQRQMFMDCYSLRQIPTEILEKTYNENATSSYNCHLNEMFRSCYALDEVVGISPHTGALTSNVFSDMFQYCHRLKNIIFQTANGTPYTANWKNQTIEIYNGVGWLTNHYNYLINYNSGITLDKEVTDPESYEALKDDPDWFSCHPSWSRFNHTSAVNLINSLPDTSAAVASGGTNSLVLRNQSGEYTDGGGCGDLTEEEIAVAAAKGWTITYRT